MQRLGKPVAASLREDKETIKDVYEPYLLQRDSWNELLVADRPREKRISISI
jgi:Holliday junction resolvasome RuvABC ATP-dependent DNA helicase subunit